VGLSDQHLALQRLELLASELDRSWPDAGASLREGMTETLTLMRLGIDGQLAKTLGSTNPCESMIEIVRYTQRNVKRWQDGDMRKRWTAAGMLVAEQSSAGSLATASSPNSSSRSNATPSLPRTAATIRRSRSPLPCDRQPVRLVTPVPRRSGQPQLL